MKDIQQLLIILVGMWMFTGCCWRDHSETIKKVVEPMAKELEYFYKVHKRFPTDKERDVMLESVGCKVKKRVCVYDGSNIKVKTRPLVYEGDSYNISFYIEKSYCQLFIDGNSGQVYSFKCGNLPCIELGQ